MKRTLIALGVIAATVSPLTAQANPKIYGKMNMAIEAIDAESAAGVAIEDNWRVSSYASRFGVRGDAELSPSLTAVYGIEWQVNADGDGTDLGQRNRFVGLKHQEMGTLKLGRLDTYLKLAQGRVDLFNDTKADISDANHGAAAIFAGETRAANVIDYQSPKIAEAITIGLQFIPGEETGAAAKYDGLTDGISSSVTYDKDGLFLSLAYDMEVAGNLALTASPAGRRDTIRLAGSYKLSDLTLGAMYQVSEPVDPAAGTATEETAMLVSAAYKID
ncbi:MAG: porin, partial [Moraxellaceae bacterium]|nr:porin [Moraxellaceae bacterium]